MRYLSSNSWQCVTVSAFLSKIQNHKYTYRHRLCSCSSSMDTGSVIVDFLRGIHVGAMSSIMEEAAENNLESFIKLRAKLEVAWHREKMDFIETHKHVSSLLNLPRTGCDRGLSSHEQDKMRAYGEVVKKLNCARLDAIRFKPATGFMDAYKSLEHKQLGGRINMHKIWDVVRTLTGEDIMHHSPNHRSISKEMSLVLGAKRYLEWEHEKYMMRTISRDPVLAALGGEVVNLKRIRAFLRVHLRDYGVLDFDAGDASSQPPVDTTWQQIFFCMRTGYYEEARTVASSSHASHNFALLLNVWITSGGMVPKEIAAAASDELDMMLRTSHVVGGASYEKEKLLLYALISGSRRLFYRLLRDQPTLFNTVDDFFWFTLSLIRDCPVGAASNVMNDGLVPYTLNDLQVYVNKFVPEYYTTNGADPLMYPYVLLLSIQLMPAIIYMSNEIGGEGYNIDAAHISIALADHGVLSEVSGARQEIGVNRVMDTYQKASSITKQYGSVNFLPGHLSMALEYYAQAAAVLGGGRLSWPIRGNADQKRQRNLMLKHLLTELLMREGGICLLLGSRGEEGELARFFTDVGERTQFLLEAAQQCREVGLYGKCIEIQKRIGAFSMALDATNKCLSEAIYALSRGRLDAESGTAGLIHSGKEILKIAKCSVEVSPEEWDSVLEQENVLGQLLGILSIHKLARLGQCVDALKKIDGLEFLKPDVTTGVLQDLSPHVQACVPDVLKVALTCLDNRVDYDRSFPVDAVRTKIDILIANNADWNWPPDLLGTVGA